MATVNPSLSTSKADWPSATSISGAAWLLGCDETAIRVVAWVEAGSEGAFLPTGEPVILFEPHVFSRETKGKYDGRRVPDVPKDDKWGVISYPTWRRGWYGHTSVQHRRLQAAAALNRTAALRSCSWGLYQLMGFNHEACNYPDIQRFVNAMYRSVDDHLLAFTQFIRHSGKLVDAIRVGDWKTFARVYNGGGQVDYYASRMAKAAKDRPWERD